MQERIRGAVFVLISAVFFALATVGAKLATQTGEASAAHVTMARFLIGLAISVPMIIRDRTMLKAKRPLWVALRAVGNVGAVFLFFFGIQFTTISKANLLNMTYPIFVFAMAPFITGERPKAISIGLLIVTMFGAWNVVRPPELSSFADFAVGDILAFSSAIVAGFSIAVLRRARQYDSSRTIVFYVMAVGAVANIGIVLGIPLPSPRFLLIAAGAGLAGTLGQYSLTIGFAHVTAATGSLLSTSRIVMAVVLGVVLFGDQLNLRTLIGAVLIVGSLVAGALVDNRHQPAGTVVPRPPE